MKFPRKTRVRFNDGYFLIFRHPDGSVAIIVEHEPGIPNGVSYTISPSQAEYLEDIFSGLAPESRRAFLAAFNGPGD